MMPYKKNNAEIKSREAFFDELSREIARIRRYGHRITLLLIEPQEKLEGALLKEFENELLNQLRTSDGAFKFEENQFTVILPNTHEAGGEAAALRIKRLICTAMNKKHGASIALSIGVISLDSGVSQDVDDVVKDLVKDLQRDKRCQSVDLKKANRGSMPCGQMLFTGTDADFINEIENLSGDKFKGTGVDSDTILNILSHMEERPVVILGPHTEFKDKEEITQKIRFNRALNDTYIIWLQNGIELDQVESSVSCDLLLPEKTLPEILWPVIRQGFQVRALKKGCEETGHFKGILSSISSATHQLNQPLQIILGRLELLMLNMDDTEDKETVDDIKTMRDQALLAADINKKIGRLAKYDTNQQTD